jgi:DNA polymerase IV
MTHTGDDRCGDPGLEPWSGRAVLHVDMDAFFASVEQLDHPEWRGRPVVVGGSPDSRGVIAAASYEARAYGVRSAMPSARAARLLPADAVWTRGDFARYGEMSHAVFTIFESFTPEVQGASIDEAYLDLTPTPESEHPVAVARAIQAAVDELGLSCSIGVATNKTVAKVASDRDKPHGITIVRPGCEASFLAPLPVRLMPGIGPATAARLTALGIRTLGDLAALDDVTAVQVLGTHGIGAVRRASGVDHRPVREREPVKSVSNERTFGTDIRDRGEVRDALAGLAEKVAGRLRRKGLSGRTVHLKVRFGDFSTRTAQVTLEEATDSTDTVMSAALRLLDSLWAPGVGVRLLGIGVTGFGSVPMQLTLPTDEAVEPDGRRRLIERAVDELRERFGQDAVRFGSRRPASRDPRDRYGPSSEG